MVTPVTVRGRGGGEPAPAQLVSVRGVTPSINRAPTNRKRAARGLQIPKMARFDCRNDSIVSRKMQSSED